MRQILITGGAGFVGRNMIRYIRRAKLNASIDVVDDFSEEGVEEEFQAQGLVGEIRQLHLQDVQGFVKHAGPYALCIHLAARVGGREHIEGKPLVVAENIAIDAAVVGAVNTGLAKELMYFSSAAAYPTDLQQRRAQPSEPWRRLREGDIDWTSAVLGRPDMTYGWAKLTGEYLCSFLRGVKCTVFRPFSGYGEDQSEKYPFPAILNRVVRGDNPVVVWGSGHQMRDFIHVKDVCDMAFKLHDWHGGGPYNLGTGVATSFFDLTAKALKVFGSPAILALDESKPEGVFVRVADVRLTSALGVVAKTSLEKGIKDWVSVNHKEASTW